MPPTRSSAESDKNRLTHAKNNISSWQSTVKSKRRSYNAAVKSLEWKGDTYKRIVKNRDIDDDFGDWLWRWGWSDDGSIDGIIDKLNKEIRGLKGIIESLFN